MRTGKKTAAKEKNAEKRLKRGKLQVECGCLRYTVAVDGGMTSQSSGKSNSLNLR